MFHRNLLEGFEITLKAPMQPKCYEEFEASFWIIFLAGKAKIVIRYICTIDNILPHISTSRNFYLLFYLQNVECEDEALQHQVLTAAKRLHTALS